MNPASLPSRSVTEAMRAGLIAGAFASIGNLVIYIVSSLLNVSFTVPAASGATEPFTVTLVHVIGETIFLALDGALVFALLSRLTSRPLWVFRAISVFVLLVSFIFPLILPTEPPMKIALCLMHMFAAIVIVTLLTRNH